MLTGLGSGRVAAAFGVAALLVFGSLGCGDGAGSASGVVSSVSASSGAASKPAFASMKHKFVIVLMDETSSFTPYWKECLDFAGKVAQRLNPGDAFAVIGIDDHGNDPDDARLPIALIDESTLRALGQKKALAKQVRALEVRKHKRDLTDILEAVHQAAIFAQGNSVEGYYPVLLFFSDMQETMHKPQRLPIPSDITGWKFATGEAHCFYVNVTDWLDPTKKQTGSTWDTMVGSWVAVLNAAGLQADAKSFHQKGNTQSEVVRLFPSSGI